MFRLDDIFFIA